ncbi:MAG: type I restriction-modification system subunit M, partial [Planktothrix sp.]
MIQEKKPTVDHHQLSNFIWQIADLLRGPYRPPQYERVMLPMTVLRRFDCVLAPTKEEVLSKYEQYQERFKDDALDSMLNKAAGQRFHNRSELTFQKLKGDPNNIDKHLVSYINGFSKNVRDIFERFEFAAEIEKMNEANILYLVVSKFCDVDLHPDQVDNIAMGSVFEDLIRRFNEAANETAGDHFTPREVIRLMVDIVFDPDDHILTKSVICKLLDPTCGTGGMLAEAQNYLRENNKEAQLWVFGQDFNPRAYAIAASDLLMKENEKSSIQFGDSLIDDKYPDETFDYFLANPPFGVDWKRQQKEVKREQEKLGFAGRFGAGLPRVNDGSLLFLQHQISKFELYQPENNKNGSRLAIVFNGSPLFTGGAGSGESEIRKWIIESDWLEAIIALPEQMFYNTGIGTYIWIVTNRKQKQRQGKIQLIDARQRWQPMRRSLGDKRRFMGEEDITIVVREYGEFVETETSKIFDNEDFGYNRVPIERPLRLLYQMDLDRKSRFLDAVPHLLDDVQAIDKQLGREPRPDWNEFDRLM